MEWKAFLTINRKFHHYFAIKHQWGVKSAKTNKSVKMTLYYNFRRHYVGMMTSPKVFCHVTSICKVSLFYLVPFKRYDNLKFAFLVTWFQNMTKNGNFITWYEFKTYQKCENQNSVHSVKVSCWLHFYFKSDQKLYFRRVDNNFTQWFSPHPKLCFML